MLEPLFLTQLLFVIALVGLSAWTAVRRFHWTGGMAWAYGVAVLGVYLALCSVSQEAIEGRIHLIPAAVALVGVGFTMVLSEQFWRRFREEQRQRLEAQQRLMEQMEKELQTAHEMQMGLMPRESPQVRGLDIAGRCVPANHVGGDFFQYFRLPQDRLALALADVTGKEMEAAIPVVMFSGILESHMELVEGIERLFGRLNRSLHRILTGRTFICFALGEFDLSTRSLRFSNGACPCPYHFRAESGEVIELQTEAYPLGVRPDTEYPVIQAQLQAGDRVVFCSDGVMEAVNATEEQFGYERTAGVIRRACAEGLSAEGTIDRILSEVNAFRGDAPQADDMTCVVVRVNREERERSENREATPHLPLGEGR